MAIQWSPLPIPLSSPMSVSVIDNDGVVTSVLDHTKPFKVTVTWTVPPVVGGKALVRAFAESIGPGPEIKLGANVTVDITSGLAVIDVPAFGLPGEQTAPDLSGVYKIVAVLQQMNPGPVAGCGFAESPLIQIRNP